MSTEIAQEARRFRPYSEALYGALTDDPFYIAMEAAAPKGQGRSAMLRYYDYSIHEAATFGKLSFPDDGAYGAALWSCPLDAAQARQKSELKANIISDGMGDTCLNLYRDIAAGMDAGTSGVVDSDDWYLSIAGLAPSHQGRGLGGPLLQTVLRQADRHGVASYLETFTPRNMPFYERLGFASVGEFVEPTTNAAYVVMRRKPPV